MSDVRITLEVWNHGSVADPGEPCGEVNVNRVSGEGLWVDFIAELADSTGKAYEYLGHLPTDCWIIVNGRICSDDGDAYLEIDSWKIT